ncbi:unnamed protein product [marine sediment metagenome]|uniref:Uncharacterized protein n=1 Tax=marine sediment metagenome TaxID=412755 RepID=X1SKQ2_9ZZZZ
MTKLQKWLIIGGIFILVVLCCLFGLGASDKTPELTADQHVKTGAAQTMAANTTATPRPIAPPCREIAEKVSTMTEAQWKAYLPTLAGNSVILWTGRVSDVNVKFGGGYELYVSMDSPDWHPSNVIFDIPDDGALEFEIDQGVVFSGTIEKVREFLGMISVYLYDVSLEN